MPHISFKIEAESISTFGTNGLIPSVEIYSGLIFFSVSFNVILLRR